MAAKAKPLTLTEAKRAFYIDFEGTAVDPPSLLGVAWFDGDEVCFVTMTGAKSGRTRTVPLMYVPHGEGVLLVASQGGAPKNPVWYHNLVKHPELEVEHRGDRKQLRARIAGPEEKAGLWPTCDQHYAPYAEYRTRTTRDIPLFVCEPR